MSDTGTTPDAPAPETAPPADTTPNNSVPYERFAEVNQKAKQHETELTELRAWKDEQESKSLSEIERANKRAEAAEKRAQDAEDRSTRQERGSWVRDAASKAGFHDPSDAIAHVDLTGIETEAQARRAVKDIAESKKHLVRAEGDKPALERVLQGNEQAGVKKDPPADGDDTDLALGRGLLEFLQTQGR